MKSNIVYISCGGTGGHFYPGLSLGRELQKQGCEVKLLLSGVNSGSQSKIGAEHGLDSFVLSRMPSPGKNPLRWMVFLRGLLLGFLQCFAQFRSKRPRALIVMGSFASLPGALCAKLLGVPIYLHDGNARIGKANRFFSRWAKVLCTAFPPVNGDKIHCPLHCTGMPLRPELEAKKEITKEEAIQGLNEKFNASLRSDLFTVLIFGGSQGAATLNSNIPRGLMDIEEKNFQVIHLTGKGKCEETRELYRRASFPYLLLESAGCMELFLGSADLVFARSGGSSVAELALFGKCAILIPFPYAAEGHQEDNARYFVNAGAGTMVRNSDLSIEKVFTLASSYMVNKEKLQKCKEAALKAAYPQAAEAFLELTGLSKK